MRRRLTILLVIATVLLIAAAITIHIVLDSNLPRRLVTDALRAQTGLEVEMQSLSTDWGGHTVMRDVTFSLPLADRPLVTVPQIVADHTGVLKLIAQRPLSIDEILIVQPKVHVEQSEAGAWNLVEAIELIQTVQAAFADDVSGPSKLPKMTVRDAEVIVDPLDGNAATLPLVSAAGEHKGGFGYLLSVKIGDAATLQGELALVGDHAHTMTVQVTEGGPLIDPWSERLGLAEIPNPIMLDATWRGSVPESGLRGMLAIAAVRAGDEHGAGRLDLVARNGMIMIHPSNLRLVSPRVPGGEAMIASGSIAITDDDIATSELALEALDARGVLTARWESEARTARGELAWSGELSGDAINHRGDVDFTVRIPPAGLGRVVAQADTNITLRTPRGSMHSQGQLRAAGADLTNLDIIMEWNRLDWTDAEGRVALAPARLALDVAWPAVALQRLTAEGVTIDRAAARYDADSQEWAIDFHARDWMIPRGPDQPAELELTARGAGGTFDIVRAAGTLENLRFDATGTYDHAATPPLQARANLQVRQPTSSATDTAPTLNDESEAGTLNAALEVVGSIEPLFIEARGHMDGRNVRLVNGVIDQLDIPLTAQITQDRATFTSGEVALLGGITQIEGEYAMSDRTLWIDLASAGTPLDRLVALLGLPIEVDGALEVDLEIKMPELDLDQLQLAGRWFVTDLQSGEWSAERGSGEVRTESGDLHLEEIELAHGEGAVRGSMRLNMQRRDVLFVTMQAVGWPIALPAAELSVIVDADADLQFRLRDATAQGELAARSAVLYRDASIGVVQARSRIDGRVLHITQIAGDVLDGEIMGEGVVPIDDLLSSRGVIRLAGLDLGELQRFVPETEAMAGRLSGEFRVIPEPNPHQLEPLRMEGTLETENAQYAGMQIGNGSLLLVAGETRAVLQQFSLAVADGTLTIGATTTKHSVGQYAHVTAEWSNLDLDQIVQAVAPEREATPGRLSGAFVAGGYLEANPRLFGRGQLRLIQSDLGSVPVFATLYELMSFTGRSDEPRGYGTASFRIEDTALEVTRLQYFNRGSEIIGSLSVDSLRKLCDGEVSGAFIGSVRPFRDLDLPIFGEADELFSALQSNAAVVILFGTVCDLQHRPATELGRSVRRLLRGLTG